jgi:hypothetical protein
MNGQQWDELSARVTESRIRAGSSAVRTLRELRALNSLIGTLIDLELIEGHDVAGHSFAALGPTRQGAQQRYDQAKKRQHKTDI